MKKKNQVNIKVWTWQVQTYRWLFLGVFTHPSFFSSFPPSLPPPFSSFNFFVLQFFVDFVLMH